ncbi:sugar ABC transporter substrate-binding protein [Alkalilimnicola ehrlichii]|uniref:Probable sugar-binding periplasmic protein n=1 Tax=Alkalilimnicola ehrlichii TaxID=351052 RepID=A0A3E0WTA1_9GAMM|nr:ABC transporter substrate-binding protein [Alkalilimnicola ehrlichii]RFA24745.1 sugar ABC transporter substrate-binding protein [Alkalilimnicola ehrlichii]RFA35423.1 sugar ABC transporter substrate-binding protein [Alkalilimnicola ehrlichii]
MNYLLKRSVLTAAVVGALTMGQVQANNVEVLHWWTSGGEARAVGVLKDLMEERGHQWRDFAVAGGGGESAMTVLRSRAVAGNPPVAAQIKGPDIQEWGSLGFLGEINTVAKEVGWQALLPEVIIEAMQHDGDYVAVPVNVHRVNWFWANPEVLAAAGVDDMPTTWEAFFEAAEAIKEAGYIPLAHGGQPWQDATVFESMLLGIGGVDFYRQAMVELDQEALASDTMIEVLKNFKRLRDYMDPNAPGREWNAATQMVVNGQAAFQIMGDWAKGELTAAGLTAGEDFLCMGVPGTDHTFTYNVDSLAMFKVSGARAREAQLDLARLSMEPAFQEAFNLAKGSIPARMDLDMSRFDSCAVKSMADFKASADAGTLVPSMAHGMAVSSDAQGAIFDVVTNYFNSRRMTAEEAAERLARAVRAAG